VADADARAVEPDRGDQVRFGSAAAEDPRVLEAVAVAGEAAGGDDRLGQRRVEAAHQLAAVHMQAVGEDQHGGAA